MITERIPVSGVPGYRYRATPCVICSEPAPYGRTCGARRCVRAEAKKNRSQEIGKAVRHFQRYSHTDRANRAASHRLGYRQKHAVGEYFWTHPLVPGIAFPTRKRALRAAAEALLYTQGNPNMSKATSEEKTKPVCMGDRFRMPSGSEWKVIETKPGGKVELFNKAESRFTTRYAREVRQWERLS